MLKLRPDHDAALEMTADQAAMKWEAKRATPERNSVCPSMIQLVFNPAVGSLRSTLKIRTAVAMMNRPRGRRCRAGGSGRMPKAERRT
jgi:hypothetical protein